MRIHPSLFFVAALTQVGATDCGQVIRDSSFDLWCGDELCAWKVTRGSIERVPTWNEGDSGVELVGSDAAIQQLTPVNHGDGTCIQFKLIADVDDKAEVFLNVDVEGDGTIERQERIPTAHWKPLSYNLRIAPPFDGIRFEVAKAGTGHAAVANIGAKVVAKADCDGLTELDPGPRRDGALCDPTQPQQCASSRCIASPTPQPDPVFFAQVCGGCDPGASACGTGTVCGVGEAFSPIFTIPTACVPAASKELGEQCLTDGECTTGICKHEALDPVGVCSTCRLDNDCSGQQCSPSWMIDGASTTGPFVCGANMMSAASGAACATDDDCASGHCNGAVRAQCSDGRTCNSPAQCPFGADGNALQNGACDTVGVQGGTCQ
jgi:hypothetical protein